MEIKSFKLLDVKADDESRTVEGWASTFGNADSDNDIILPGAFAESIKSRLPKMLWQHRSDQLIGKWTDAYETGQGLYVKGTISKTQLGNDAYELLKDGSLDSMSIGFAIEKYSIDQTSNTRTIQKVDLWEVSLVTFPANSLARVTGVKSKPQTLREFEEFLREEGRFSREDATTIALHGYKALNNEREADWQSLLNTIQQTTNSLRG